MNVILSIKPKYVKHILDGTKKFEFRKIIFKQNVEKIYIYSSSPVMRIVACFKIEYILAEKPSVLWDICSYNAGISYEEFNKYFSQKKVGYAIKITNLKIFEEPISPQSVIVNFKAPQSFMYIEKEIEKLITI